MKLRAIKYCLSYLVLIPSVVFSQGFTIGTNAVFSLGSATLNLSNNFENNGTFNPQSGTVAFSGPSGIQTYTDVTGVTLNNLTINKAAGELQLSNNITVNGVLTCTSGDLNLNGKIIYLGPTANLSESAGATVKGSSGHIEATRVLNAPNNYDFAGLGVVITSAADLGSTQIIRKHNQQPVNSSGSILRYYDIAPTNNTNLDATLTMFYDPDELNGLDENFFEIFRSTNGGLSWLKQGGIVDVPNKKVSLSNINSFSLWTLANNQSITISNAGGIITCNESYPVRIFDSILLNDPDDENCAGATFQIINNYISTEDKLVFGNQFGISGVWDVALGKLTLTGIATKDQYVSAIRSVEYRNLSDSPTESVRTLSLVVNDGSGDSNILTREVSVIEVNDSPYLQIHSNAYIVEGGVIIFNNSHLFASDKDGSPDMVTYNLVELPSHGYLFLNNSLLSPGSSFSQYNIATGCLVYFHNGDEDDMDYFTFTLTDDRGGVSYIYRFTINVASKNDPPIAEDLSSILMKEDEPFLLGISNWYECVFDPDDNDSTLTFYLDCNSDKISIVAISDTLYQITSEENYFGTDTLDVVFKDPAGDSCFVNAIIIIEPVNDCPEFIGFPSEIEITQGMVESIEILNMVSDIETPDSLLKVSLIVGIDSIFTNYSPKSGIVNILSICSYQGETSLTITVTDADGCKTTISTILNILADVTSAHWEELPSNYILYNNYPNPFNPTTIIRYGIPVQSAIQSEAFVILKIYDILGKEVTTLVSEYQRAGYYEITWNAVDIASGIYFYMLSVKSKGKEFQQVNKMLLVR